MSEPVEKEFKIAVTFNPEANTFSTSLQPPPGAGPDYVWELLKTAVLAMRKSHPYFSDPDVRQTVQDAANGMLLISMGADAQLEKLKAQREAMSREF